MTSFSVIALLAIPTSGAASTDIESADSRAQGSLAASRVTAPEHLLLPTAAYVVYGERCRSARNAVVHYRALTWARQAARAGQLADRTPIVRDKTCRWSRYAAGEHQARAKSALRSLERWFRERRNERRSLYEKWRCIHEHEGAWNSNTGNGYYGGLQMDVTFQLSHGREFYKRWGTADRWPVWAQIAAAEDAYVTRGFAPWPSTSRMCGLR